MSTIIILAEIRKLVTILPTGSVKCSVKVFFANDNVYHNELCSRKHVLVTFQNNNYNISCKYVFVKKIALIIVYA